MTSLRPVAIAAGPAASAALPELRRALDGQFAVLPYAAGGNPPAVPSVDGAGRRERGARRARRGDTPPGDHAPAAAEPDEGTALVVGTSGSTGSPKLAMLPAEALRASADATHERLGGPGGWLLAMPPHHIAGVQVLMRCISAGAEPGFVDLAGGFTAEAFVRAATRFQGPRRYTALVPTQLVRLLDDAHGTRALADFHAVLVGGAASSPALLDRARDNGIEVVTTYGMSETSGGCVYDGTPLSCSLIRADHEGRLHLGGATLATGYLGRPDLTHAAFGTDPDGTRWFATDDLGHADASGTWHVDGRLDDVVVTGGVKVAPRPVEEALTSQPGIREAVVLGTPDELWGQAVSAALVLRAGAQAPTVRQLREQLRGILPDHALPRRVLVVDALPQRGPGKPDRAALAALFSAPA